MARRAPRCARGAVRVAAALAAGALLAAAAGCGQKGPLTLPAPQPAVKAASAAAPAR